MHGTPPVFDGPEDRNGRRNADEVRFWQLRLDGAFGPPPDPPFVMIGTFNLDPHAGDGRLAVMRNLLADPRIADPPGLSGRPTAHFPPPGPGAMRVDYILPDAGLAVRDAGIMAAPSQGSRHNPIWVDVLPQALRSAPAGSGN